MATDEVIEEVRRIRRQIDSTYATDEEYYQHLLDVQEKHKDRLTTRSPQKWPPVEADVRRVAEPTQEWKTKR